MAVVEGAHETVVVPLVPVEQDPSTEVLLRLLINREALVIERNSAPISSTSSGMTAQAGGVFAKAVGQAIAQSGRQAGSADLYRVVLPSGAVARDLVPAVGGGYRALVRTGSSTVFSGQARLIPAAAGTGAAMAAGPLIAVVGLAVVGEMLAQHQTNKKLSAIRGAVVDVQRRLQAEERAVLATAGQEAQKVAGYLLDQAVLPPISAAAHAFGDLAALANRQIEQLDRWSEVVIRQSERNRVNGADLMDALIGKQEDQIRLFEREVVQTYESLALRARVVVLEKVAAEFVNPGRSLPHIEDLLRLELSALSDRQTQLSALLDDLSAMQIDGSKVPIAVAGRRSIGIRTSFGRLARALHATPDGLPVLTADDRAVLELSTNSKGFSIDSPTAT